MDSLFVCCSYISSSTSATLSPLICLQNLPNSTLPVRAIGHRSDFSTFEFEQQHATLILKSLSNCTHRRGIGSTRLRASSRESPYQVLGISPSAAPDEIKRAYRKLALKYHPDVNKQKNAQEKFLRIKHAYNTLMNSASRKRYDSGGRTSDYSYSSTQSKNMQDAEEFYGLEDFFKDIQQEFQNREASASSQEKPKSLWEELAEIGEDFVEFLEKELNITNEEVAGSNPVERSETEKNRKAGEGISTDDNNIDDIEATLAQLKKELGL